MLIGYARVSTHEQNLSLQCDALTKAGCAKIYEDKISGMRSDRPGLNALLQNLRQGDTVVVWKLDRLGRSLKGLIDFTKNLEDQGIHFKSLTDHIDTSTSAGRFFFHVMASLAQMERDLIIDRTKAGLAAAKKYGRTGGRKRKMSDSKLDSAKRLLASGRPRKEVAVNLGISIPTLYRWLPASNNY